MFDQSFCINTLERTIRKKDFDHKLTAALQEIFRQQQITLALDSANTSFNKPSNPLGSFPLHGKNIYRFTKLSDDLVARKLCDNLKRYRKKTKPGRSQIVQCLNLLLTEGVPFRVYRLDIKSFYESFNANFVDSSIRDLASLSPHSKSLLISLLASYRSMGGTGIPRGLSLSALLSEILMRSFDLSMVHSDNVYYYARYVDDIIVITSDKENSKIFLNWTQAKLPEGLNLNTQKQKVSAVPDKVIVAKGADQTERLRFDYLGYSFSVLDPVQIKKLNPNDHHRDVTVDIAAKKIAKIKTRIIRSLVDHSRQPDWELLRDRLKFLRQNFSVHNPKIGTKKLAGIYHSYPEISPNAVGLLDLDRFLKNAVLSKSGRVFSKSSPHLSPKEKRELLSQSFVRGHQEQTFVHFSGKRINQIQRCWLY